MINKNKKNNDIDLLKLSWHYLTYLFNKKDFIIYDTIKLFKLDDISLYSMTPHYYAEKTTRIIKNYYDNINDMIISDFCCCIGGNSFNFIKYFKHVNCVELDENRFEYLKHNMMIYKQYKNYSNYSLYNDNCLEIVKSLKQDIIFIDPPWNGKDYKNQEKMDLYIDKYNSVEFCNYFLNYCKMIVLKIPNNFNVENFDKIQYKYNIYNLNIFKIIIITNNKIDDNNI